jgi:hypothetical protein
MWFKGKAVFSLLARRRGSIPLDHTKKNQSEMREEA